MSQERPIVFISCGQFTQEERKLGESAAEMVRKLTPFDAYFAQTQNTVEAFTQNILGRLNRCVGFIAILHDRGQVKTPAGEVTRASVWIEQEIAVAAFVAQILARPLLVRVYVQTGVAREGMRDKLLLNPITFDSHDQILDDLEAILPNWKLPEQAAAPSGVDVGISYEKIRISGERHDYRLLVKLQNASLEEISQYRVEVQFPLLFLSTSTIFALEVSERRTKTHRFFRMTEKERRVILYPGDPVLGMTLDYFVDATNYDAPDALNSEVTISVWTPKTGHQIFRKSMRDLQIF